MEFLSWCSGWRIRLGTMRLRVQSLALLSGLRIRCCRDVGCRCGSDPELLWLWHRLAATAPIQPLAWEPPYAAGAAREMAKRQKKKKKKKRKLKLGSGRGILGGQEASPKRGHLMAQRKWVPRVSMRMQVRSLASISGSGIWYCHALWGSDPTLLWMQRRLAVPSVIRPLAWELPYVAGAALKSKK